MTSVIIYGYGKVGQELLRQINASNTFQLRGVIDRSAEIADWVGLSQVDCWSEVDVVIDFTDAQGFISLIKFLSTMEKRPVVVSGSSGWQAEKASIVNFIEKAEMRVLYGANFSLSTALFIELTATASRFFNNIKEIDVAVHEIHHRKKKDQPSGTAYAIAQRIVDEFDTKNEIVRGTDQEMVEDHQLHISSLRLGSHLGGHEVLFDSPTDIVSLKQETKSRSVYASGSLIAAQWLLTQEEDKYYTFQDFILSIINH